MSYWTEAQLQSIHHMLNPGSIAIVGATQRMQYGGRMLNAALKAKGRINVYPVNPRYEELMGVKCYPSVSALPEAPDLVGIVVPYNQALDVLKESHAKGAKSAVIISAGFSERGESDRADLQGELSRFAQESGLRVAGPNCLGLANVKDDIWASSSSRGSDGLSGPIGLVCQSGASAFGPFLVRAVDEGVGYSYIVSTGNEADLDFADFARYLLDDPATRVIAGFVEGFKNGRKFLELAKLAAEKGKPIVLIKIGRSELGTRAARSHTAALTGEDALYEAAFSQYGVIRVQDYDEMIQVARLMAQAPKPKQRGVAAVSHSGGISSLTADMCGQQGLELPPLADAARDGINGILKGFGWASNPSDVTGFANGPEFPAIMTHLVDQPNIGILAVASAGADTQAEQVIAQRDRTGKPVVFLWTGSRTATAGLGKLKAGNIPVFYTPDKMAFGIRSLLNYHEWRDKRTAAAFPAAPAISAAQNQAVSKLRGLGHLTLSESESKQLIGAWGVALPCEERANSAAAAAAIAEKFGYPVALKVDSPDIPHKTEAGVVRLNLRDAAQVLTAYDEIILNAKRHAPQAKLNGVSVQEMVQNGVETIVGVNYDAQLGPVLLFGTGGVTVEVYRDVAFRVCPIDRAEAISMIDSVKGSRLLKGFRGRPEADVAALADTLVKVSHLAVSLEGTLAELDINPLLVMPQGQGVKAVDALAVLKG